MRSWLDYMLKYNFDVEKMENSPLRQKVKSKTQGLNEYCTEVLKDKTTKSGAMVNIITDGFEQISKSEYCYLNNLLVSWGINKAGAVIKREGPTHALNAAHITLANINKVESPKKYFRQVLKNLQNS